MQPFASLDYKKPLLILVLRLSGKWVLKTSKYLLKIKLETSGKIKNTFKVNYKNT